MDIKTGDDTVDLLLQQAVSIIRSEHGRGRKSAFGGFVMCGSFTVPELSPHPIYCHPAHTSPPFSWKPSCFGNMIWQTVKSNGSTVWRWVEHRDNHTAPSPTCSIKGQRKLGRAETTGRNRETNVGLKDTEQYPDGVDRLVFYVPNLYRTVGI